VHGLLMGMDKRDFIGQRTIRLFGPPVGTLPLAEVQASDKCGQLAGGAISVQPPEVTARGKAHAHNILFKYIANQIAPR
jgi:hypothetical protein